VTTLEILWKRRTKLVTEAQPFFDDASAALHVFDGLARFALNALDQVGDFPWWIAWTFRPAFELHRQPRRSRDRARRRERPRWRRLGQADWSVRPVVNDFDDLPDVIGTVPEDVDDFRGRLNGLVGAIKAIGGLLHGPECP